MPFEVLHGAFMLLGRGQCRKSSQIPALAGLRVNLSRIKTVLSGSQFTNHGLRLQKPFPSSLSKLRPAKNRFPAGLLFQPGRRPPKTGSRAEESYTTFLLALRRFLLVRRRLSRVRFARGECRYVTNALLIACSDMESRGI